MIPRLAVSVPEALRKLTGDKGDNPRAILSALVSRIASDDTEPRRHRKRTKRKENFVDGMAIL